MHCQPAASALAPGRRVPLGGDAERPAATALAQLLSRALWASAYGALALLIQVPEVFGL
jgi:hypothetical protein